MTSLTVPEMRREAWKTSGKSAAQTEALLQQEALFKKFSEVSSSLPTATGVSPSSSGVSENHTAVQLSTSQNGENLKKLIAKSKQPCRNGLLIASYFPIFGIISSAVCKTLLAKKIKQTSQTADTEKLSKQLIARQNQYRISSITSTLITLAIAVSVLATGIFTGGIIITIGASLAAGVFVFSAAIVTYDSIKLIQSKRKEKAQEPISLNQ